MKRITMIKAHLYLSAIAAPFILMMALTGTFYLFNIKGSEEVNVIKTIQLSKADLTQEVITNELKGIDKSYTFEYVKKVSYGAITRPTTRAYYKFKQVPNGIEVSHIRPDLLRKLIEVHKGHSSSIVKTYEKAVGIFLFLIVLTGLYLAFTMKREKKLVVGLFLVGCLIFFFL